MGARMSLVLVATHVQVAEENLGELPRRLELDIELSWKAGGG